MIVTLDEALQFLDIEGLEFTITGNNNLLMLKYDDGTTTEVQLVNNTYSSDGMIDQLESAIDTAFTINSNVEFTNEKFVIDVGSGHTIQYIHLNSTLGIDLGFTEDSAISQSITSDVTAGDPTAIVDNLREMIDALTKSYCKRDFEVGTYKEKIESTGIIFTNQFPIISVGRISSDCDFGLSVKNTGASSFATVSVSETMLSLFYDNAQTDIPIIATTTIEDLWNSINAESGWEANIASGIESYLATELLAEEGLFCFNSWAELPIRAGYLSGFDIEYSTGSIVPENQISRKVVIDYSAGYSTMPEDLKMAVLIWIKALYDKRNEEVFGVRTFTLDRVRKSYFNSIPMEVKTILDLYRKYDW